MLKIIVISHRQFPDMDMKMLSSVSTMIALSSHGRGAAEKTEEGKDGLVHLALQLNTAAALILGPGAGEVSGRPYEAAASTFFWSSERIAASMISR